MESDAEYGAFIDRIHAYLRGEAHIGAVEKRLKKILVVGGSRAERAMQAVRDASIQSVGDKGLAQLGHNALNWSTARVAVNSQEGTRSMAGYSGMRRSK